MMVDRAAILVLLAVLAVSASGCKVFGGKPKTPVAPAQRPVTAAHAGGVPVAPPPHKPKPVIAPPPAPAPTTSPAPAPSPAPVPTSHTGASASRVRPDTDSTTNRPVSRRATSKAPSLPGKSSVRFGAGAHSRPGRHRQSHPFVPQSGGRSAIQGPVNGRSTRPARRTAGARPALFRSLKI